MIGRAPLLDIRLLATPPDDRLCFGLLPGRLARNTASFAAFAVLASVPAATICQNLAKICRMCPVVLRLADHRHRSRMVFLDAVDKADLPARPSSAILQPPQEHSPLQGNIRPLGAFVGAREAARQCPSLTAAPASARGRLFLFLFLRSNTLQQSPFLECTNP